MAWNLAGVSPGAGACGRDARVCVARDEHVDVHLTRDGAQRVEVAGRDTLVAVYDADADRCVHDRR